MTLALSMRYAAYIQIIFALFTAKLIPGLISIDLHCLKIWFLTDTIESEGTFMFKSCNVCKYIWYSRQDFINDRDIEIIGYQANFKKLEAGFLYFNHSCKNTIILSANRFIDLYDGPIFKEAKTGTDECPEYCLNKEELRPCTVKCECAYIREIIQLFKGAENIKIA